jgi:lipoprotein-anchoring transpeptidase ErfK/SrfK
VSVTLDPASARQYAALYAAIDGEPFPIPAVRLTDVDPTFLRKSVYYSTGEPAGTIIIDPANHFLYLVQGGGKALRYSVLGAKPPPTLFQRDWLAFREFRHAQKGPRFG